MAPRGASTVISSPALRPMRALPKGESSETAKFMTSASWEPTILYTGSFLPVERLVTVTLQPMEILSESVSDSLTILA